MFDNKYLAPVTAAKLAALSCTHSDTEAEARRLKSLLHVFGDAIAEAAVRDSYSKARARR